MKRILIGLLIKSMTIVPMFAQEAEQKTGIPGVQHSMSDIIPDAEYAIPDKGNPDWLAIGEDQVWVNSKPTDYVFRMDPKGNKVVAMVPVPKPCSGLMIAAGTLWSPSCEENVIYRIDISTNKVVAKVPVGPANTEGGIAFGAGSAWMPSDPKGVVSRIDPAANKIIAKINVAPGSFTAVFGFGHVWISSTEKNLISVIDPNSNKVIREIPVDPAPRFMAAGEGYVWSLNQTNGTVTKIDPSSMNVLATIPVGVPGTGGDIAAGEGAIWVSARTIPVSRIDPVTNKVTAQFVGPGGDALRAGNGYVWLSNGRNSNVWRFTPSRLPAGPPSAGPTRINDRAGLVPGSLVERWVTGGPNCLTVPDWQVHEYNEDFYILRESGCINAEKPFLYLIFGEEKALLEDTGVSYATPDHSVIPTAPFIMDLLAKWAQRKHHAPVSLIVIHSHSHADHTAADSQFKAMSGVQFVEAKPEEIQKAAGIKIWPTDIGQIDLGKRIIDVIPIPGHDFASIALYDRWTGNLMTGDSLYPGRLYVQDDLIPTYAASAKRLVDFVKIHRVAYVLGTHIEQGSQPYFDYPRGTRYQPQEHVLELSRAHVFELNEAFIKMNGKPIKMVYPDFAVVPRSASVPLSATIQAGDGLGLEAGEVPKNWKSGGPNCLTIPDWQVQEYNEDFYILRESGCINPEKPFLYLIFGENKALLEDTGVARTTPDANGETVVIPTAPVIMDLLAQWAKRKNHSPVSLVVIHSHAHGDHTAADKQFQALPDVQFIAAKPTDVQKAAGIKNWPEDIGHIDLGGRMVDVIPIPGHNEASIALYDRLTGNLLTGDSLYPGLLSLAPADLAAFSASAQRLADFASEHLIAHVLGAHIEQKSNPYVDYGRGTAYQPEEHAPELTRAHIFELNEAFLSLHGKLEEVATPDFTIVARGAATAYPTTTNAK